jgi:hypothetical protein
MLDADWWVKHRAETQVARPIGIQTPRRFTFAADDAAFE